MLSCLSYNVQFGKKINQVITWIDRHSSQFDIICLQEFPFGFLAAFTETPLGRMYPHQTALSFRKNAKEYGLLTMINTKKVTIHDTETLHLGTSFFEDKILGFTGGRSALLMQLSYQTKQFTLVNTHLVAYGSNKHRREQMTKIITYMANRTQQKQLPVVIVGDLNYSSLTQQGRLIELMQSYGFINAHTKDTHRLFNIKSHQLDYLFYKNMRIEDIAVHDVHFSDHLPITFTLMV